MKVWILYEIDCGYPEDHEITMEVFRICKDENEAKELLFLSDEIHVCAWHESIVKSQHDAFNLLKSKYGLDDLPNLKIVEAEFME